MEGEEAEADWKGNDEADALAKTLCKTVFGEAGGHLLDDHQAADHVEALKRFAIAAGWAVRNGPTGTRRGKSKRGARNADEGNPERIGAHQMRRSPGGDWECALCKLQGNTAASRRSLRSKQCKGEITLQCHPSHSLCWKEGFLWCDECAAYTTRQPRQLRLPCPGKAAGETRRNILRRLRDGLPPTTAKYALSHKVCHRDAEDDAALEHWIRAEARPGHAPDDHQRSAEDEAAQPAARGRRQAARSLPPTARGTPRPRAGRRATSAGSRPTSTATQHGPRNVATSSSASIGASAAAQAALRVSLTSSTFAYRDVYGGEPAAPSAGTASYSASPSILCSPQREEAWTRRLLPGPGMELADCNICSTATRTRCRGCHRPTCWNCARARASCVAIRCSADEPRAVEDTC